MESYKGVTGIYGDEWVVMGLVTRLEYMDMYG